MKRLLVFVKMHTLLSIVLAPVVVLLIMMVLGCPLLFIRGPFGPNRLTEGYMALFMVLILLVSLVYPLLLTVCNLYYGQKDSESLSAVHQCIDGNCHHIGRFSAKLAVYLGSYGDRICGLA